MLVYQTENQGKRYEYRSNPHSDWEVPPHLHEFSEIAFTSTGMTRVTLDGRDYRLPPGHLILILPNQIHEYSVRDSQMRCAVFSNDHIAAFFEKYPDRIPENPVLDLGDEPGLLAALESCKPDDTLRLCGILNLLCAKLTLATRMIPRRSTSHALLSDVVRYLSEHFREDIRLTDVAKRLGYHEKYLSGVLHRLTGMNFRRFLATYRIDLAKELLGAGAAEQLRIGEVALRCGFSSINSFNRAFLLLTGMTPSQYRAQVTQACSAEPAFGDGVISVRACF